MSCMIPNRLQNYIFLIHIKYGPMEGTLLNAFTFVVLAENSWIVVGLSLFAIATLDRTHNIL